MFCLISPSFLSPHLYHLSVSQSSSSFTDLSNALYSSNLLYLHASNQPYLLGPYTSHTTPLPHVLIPSAANDLLLAHSPALVFTPPSESTLPHTSSSTPSSNPDSSCPISSTSHIPSPSPSLPAAPTVPVQHPM